MKKSELRQIIKEELDNAHIAKSFIDKKTKFTTTAKKLEPLLKDYNNLISGLVKAKLIDKRLSDRVSDMLTDIDSVKRWFDKFN